MQIVHEFKELGILQLESGKTIDSEDGTVESYWMRANFEALSTGAIRTGLQKNMIKSY